MGEPQSGRGFVTLDGLNDGIRGEKRTRPVLGLFVFDQPWTAHLIASDGPCDNEAVNNILPLHLFIEHGWRFCSVPPPSTTLTARSFFFLEFVGRDA